jgi:hypothetical protein
MTDNNFWSTIANNEEISGLVLPPKRGYYLITTITSQKWVVLYNGVYWQSPETQMSMPIANWYYDPEPANVLQILLEEGD